MKKIKTNLGLIAVLILAFAVSPAVFADENASGNVHVGIQSTIGVNADDHGDDASAHMGATANIKADDEENDSQGANEQAEDKADISSDSHRSAVSLFVKNLLQVADREHGIGAEVKIIAQEQNDSSERVASAIGRVEARSKWKSFWFGTDYKSVGMLRSEMVKTSAEIVRLQALSDQTTDATDKAALNAEIKVLEDEQAKIQAFITLHEDHFSLFGWFVKRFEK